MAKQTNEFEAKLKIAELTYELNKARDRIHTLEEDNDKLSRLKKYKEPFLKMKKEAGWDSDIREMIKE